MSDFEELRKKNLALAKKLVKESVNADLFIINAVNNIEEIQRVGNTLSKRLREWYSLYFPELDKHVADNKEYAQQVLKGEREHLLTAWKVHQGMGADLEDKELEEIRKLAHAVIALFDEEMRLTDYVDRELKARAPNVFAITGGTIGAKLLRGAGSLRKFAMMRSSTIQLIGAEKALFRHIKTGARPPKYGFLLQHPLVQKMKREDRGRVARQLADKIFIAARLDYFKGEFLGEKLLRDVEEKNEVRNK